MTAQPLLASSNATPDSTLDPHNIITIPTIPMTSPATLLRPREGRTQTDILGALAHAQFEGGESYSLRQRELVEQLPHSKGTISNNIKKLVETGLVSRSERRYRIDEDGILLLYREHVDSFLARERADGPFDAELRDTNEVRTETKRRLPDLFEENDLLVSAVMTAFIESTEVSHLRTVPDVCHYADELVRQAATRVVTSEEFTDETMTDLDVQTLLRLGVVLDRTRDGLARLAIHEDVLRTYMPGNPPTQIMLAHLNGGDTQ